jgi:uncharacterized membrane protein
MGFIFVLKRIGFFIIDNWRVVLIGLAILTVIIASGLTYRWCGNRKAKLNEQQIQKAQDAVKTRNDEKLKQILAEADTAEENIDAGIKQAEINTANAKKKYDHLSSDELAKELENRK